MKLTIDTDANTLVLDDAAGSRSVPLYSAEAFTHLSDLWVKVGWDQKYSYGFTWMGRPIIQLPEDIVRIQETIYRVKPDVIIETGVAHGGSLIFYASLLRAMGKGRVVGVDIKIRPENRASIESHEMSSSISLIEGSSTDPAILEAVKTHIEPGDRVLVLLDSDHSFAHVAHELELYAPLVTPGSYIVATDGIMEALHDVPRGVPGWRDDNPSRAAREFAAKNVGFELEKPPFLFGEASTPVQTTHWPDAYLLRKT